jgi:hypothetical protein
MNPALDETERESLRDILEEVGEVTGGGVGLTPGWMTLIAVIRDVGGVLGAVNGLVVLSQNLKRWRARIRESGGSTSVHLQSGGGPALDLESATDEEIDAWFRFVQAKVRESRQQS